MRKWGWRILSEKDSLWHKILSFKYGDIKKARLDNSFFVINSKSSLWLRDLRDLLGSWNAAINWFGSSFSCKLGKDNDIDFWRGCWIDT